MGLALMAKERRDMRHGPQEAKIHAMAFDCRQGISRYAAREAAGGDGREGAGQRACSLRCCRAGAFSKLRVHVPSSRLHWRSRCSSGLLEGKMGRFCSELKLTSSHLSSGSSDKESGQWFNIVEGRTEQRFSIKINPAKMLLQRTA